MGVRKVGRSRIAVNGREFVWWMHNDGESLRIASGDKRFVVAYSFASGLGDRPLLRVSGPEFPGIAPTERRPAYVIPPEFDHWYSWKSLARRIIEWSLCDGRTLVRPATPPQRRF